MICIIGNHISDIEHRMFIVVFIKKSQTICKYSEESVQQIFPLSLKNIPLSEGFHHKISGRQSHQQSALSKLPLKLHRLCCTSVF